MSVEARDDVIALVGECHVEDAEPLAAALADRPRPVDVSQCRHLHGAVLQALLALGATVTGTAEDDFLTTFVAPNLRPSDAPDETSL